MPDYKDTLSLFTQNGQEHILADWDRLLPDQQEQLLENCARVDFAWLKARWDEFQAASAHAPARAIKPAPVTELPKTDADRAKWNDATAKGEEILRQGKAAAFLVAGGQGTRLGFSGPKGTYPIGPVSGRTLFQWHAEQILARSRRYGAAIPWYLMTSRDNDADTRQFLADNGNFGLPEKDIIYFQQDMVPSLDFNGKLMLATPSTLAMNPNGHGGSLFGLERSGALKNMRERGIEYISYFQVDNPLVTICDPAFLGWHALSGSEMSSKVLEKNSPDERIGVACIQDGKPAVVEYIDMSPEDQSAMGPDGRLRYWAGSIAIHIINVSFAEKIAKEHGLPWHQSKKKVAHFEGNRLVKPDKENAVKFETFVFDALPYAKKALNLEVCREDEFAPVKNAVGVDSAVSCRGLLSNHFLEWLADCGIPVPVGGKELPVVEISPLYALDGGELAAKVKPDGFMLENTLLLG